VMRRGAPRRASRAAGRATPDAQRALPPGA
jgi:hypothetical protein